MEQFYCLYLIFAETFAKYSIKSGEKYKRLAWHYIFL